jgi:probable rRNA maturation factor
MDALHRRHTGVAGTTDVLTFDLREMGLGPLDVDIVVCLDEADRQAASRGHAVERELLLYVVHGLMHCLGHDDHEEAACARMHAAEDAVLTAIGVGPVYARPEGGGR